MTKCSDLMKPWRTEPKVTGKTNYNQTYSGSQQIKYQRPQDNPKTKPRTEKVNEILLSTRNYQPATRHHNRQPRFEKKLKTTYLRINKVSPNLNEKIIIKKLNREGLNPVKFKLEKNTISHQHKGKGIIVVESSDPKRVKNMSRILKNLNIDVKPTRNFDALIKY